MATASQDNNTPSTHSRPFPGDSKFWYWLVWIVCFLLLMLARKAEPGHDSGHRVSSQEYNNPCELLFAREDRVVFFDRDSNVPHLMSMAESGAVTSYSTPAPKKGNAHPGLVSGDSKSNLMAAVEKCNSINLLVVWRMEAADICWTQELPNGKINRLLWCGSADERHLLVFETGPVGKGRAQLLEFRFPALLTYGDDGKSAPHPGELRIWPDQKPFVYHIKDSNDIPWLWDGPPVLMNREVGQNQKASNEPEDSADAANILIRLRRDGGNVTFALGWLCLNLKLHTANLKQTYLHVCPNSYAWAVNGRLIAAGLSVKTPEEDSAMEESKAPSDVVFWPREVSEVKQQNMIPAEFNADDSRVIGSLEGHDDEGKPYPHILLIETRMKYAGYNLWVMTLSEADTHFKVSSLHEMTYRSDIKGAAIATLNSDTLRVALVDQANSPTSHKSVCAIHILSFNKENIAKLTRPAIGLKQGWIAEHLQQLSKALPSVFQQTFCAYLILIVVPGYLAILLIRKLPGFLNKWLWHNQNLYMFLKWIGNKFRKERKNQQNVDTATSEPAQENGEQ